MNFTSYTLNSKGRILLIQKPLVMGVLNVTLDSFYSGSRVSLSQIVEKAGNMLEDGASILDIGGQSTRPGSKPINPGLELEKVIPAIDAIRTAFPECWISIDTYYASVAEDAVLAGADIVNDISAGDDDANMISVVAKLGIPFIAMHKQGNPETMQNDPKYNNVLLDIIEFFKNKKSQLEKAGITDWILDPGFGFGKTLENNYYLLKNLESFTLFNKPILVGISRKGMIQKALNVTAENGLNGTTVLNTIALMKSASILRVHDVKEAVEVVKLHELIS